MGNLIEFGRMFLSYGLLMVIILIVIGIAVFIGIKMAMKKNAEKAEAAQEITEKTVSGEEN